MIQINNKIPHHLIIGILLIMLGGFAFAQEYSANDDSNYSYQEENLIEENPSSIKPQLKGYTYNLKRLIDEAKENIKKVDKDLENLAVGERNEERKSEAVRYMENGNALYKAGKIEEAREEWEKALKVTENPEMSRSIKYNTRMARKKEAELAREERKRQKRLAAEQRKKRPKREDKRLLAKEVRRGKGLRKTVEEEALQQVKPKEKPSPERINSLYQQALDFYDNYQLEESRKIFEQILDFDPSESMARSYLDTMIPLRKEQLAVQESKAAELERLEAVARKKRDLRGVSYSDQVTPYEARVIPRQGDIRQGTRQAGVISEGPSKEDGIRERAGKTRMELITEELLRQEELLHQE